MNTPIRIGINGYGRIGRATLRTALGRDDVEVVAINDVMDEEQIAYLTRYDSTWGRLDHRVELIDGDLLVGDQIVAVSNREDPADLPWDDLDVDVGIESTGLFRRRDQASAHLDAGAETVIISAPPKGDKAVPQFVYGVNHDEYGDEDVVSAASCTTNSVSLPMYVALQEFGVNAAEMTTIHAYTGSQHLIDGPAEKTRRGRAAAENIVPTTTGAATATTEILPELEGSFDATAVRVPVPSGSITEIVLDLAGNPDEAAINDALEAYARGDLADAMGVTTDPIVSADIVGQEYGSYVDLAKTSTADNGSLAKIFTWYDNEIGYASQLLHLAATVGDVAPRKGDSLGVVSD